MSTQSSIKKLQCLQYTQVRCSIVMFYMMVSHDVLYCVYTSSRTLAGSDFVALFLLLHHFLERVEDEVTSDVKAHVLEGKSAVLNLATPFLTSRFVVRLQGRSTHNDKNWSVMNRDPQMEGPELTASHCQLRSHTQELSDPSACH